MRILVVVILALVALGAGGVWALGQFGDSFTSTASEPREPVVLEPQITLAANEPAAAPATAPTPAPSKPAAKPASKPATPKSEPAKSQPAPAAVQPAAPAAAETQATPAPPPPPADAPAATPVAPAKPNPFKANSLDSSKPADALSQLLPGAKSAAPSAPAAPPAEAPAASAPAASASAAPAAPAPSAPATAQAAPAQPAQAQSAPAKAADPILKPQQVDAPAAANTAATAGTGLQAQLKSRAITYNRPPAKLALNKTVDVTLVINATEDKDAGQQALQGSKGEVVERNIDLSDIVSAQLTSMGGGFKITPLTVERQKLSGKMINRWQWSVEPTEIGTHTLILDIFGYESGSPDAEQLAAYQDQITVEVQQLDQVIGWAKGVQPLFAVLAALAGLTSAGVAFLRFRDERKAKKAAKSS